LTLSESEQPEPFVLKMRGPFGHYTISFVRNGDEGEFLVSSGAAKMTWRVEVCERANGGWRLAGLTQGTVEIWGDTYWFECHVTQPVRVDYSVQGVLWSDYGDEQPKS
jgi:hypothetical protein